ncbi:hypothetical protein IFM89_011933 [Coptis chinensis]|uniref:No apical meristem-associated C-terminal domain-containing protein n=1 Tax=Coptis chinensis TaxID=261450 RepID=A0A835H4K9_9MAGN|nr:hypothetical protein IFM89_011933 [Coptis chinensis]
MLVETSTAKERPIGCKAEKDRRKKHADTNRNISESNAIMKSFTSSLDERLERSEKMQMENLQLKREKMHHIRLMNEKMIMDTKLDGMTLVQREWYQLQQAEILQRWKESSMGGGNSSGGKN